MKKSTILLSLLITLMAIFSCQDSRESILLAEAETFLPAHADSAAARLDMLNIEQMENEEDAAHYALLRVMTNAIMGVTANHDTLIERAYEFYCNNPNNSTSDNDINIKHYAQSALYMGNVYVERDSITKSEECFRKAISYSEKAKDWYTHYFSCTCLAEQMLWQNEDKALELLFTAIDSYHKCRANIINLVYMYERVANCYTQLASKHGADSCYQLALEYAQKALKLAKDSCDLDTYNESLLTMASVYWAKDEADTTLYYAKKVNILDWNSENSQRMNMKVAKYHLKCDSFAKAKQLFQTPRFIKDNGLKYQYARGMAETAIRMQMPADSILLYMNKAFSSHETKYLETLIEKHDYNLKVLEAQKRIEKITYKSKLRTWLFIGIICIILISSILVAWLLELRIRMHREQRKHEMQLMREQQERKEEEARFLEKEMSLLKESQKQKMATIKHLQNYIIDRTDVTMKLKDGGSRVRMSTREWNEIERLLNEIDDKSITRIIANFEGLTTEDIRLCIMVRIGMSNPAIGNVYGITPSAVQHRKQALKKKVFGVTDPNTTLNDFINALNL